MKRTIGIMALALMAATGSALAANYCGELKNAYGPLDYRAPGSAGDREIVTGAHFTETVQAGVRGNTGAIGGDLDYTLRAIPNHPGALAVMGKVGITQKTTKLYGATYPVECYFDRAMRFAPDDGAVRAAYGNYLFALGKPERALEMYRAAALLAPEDATINYNLGLAYLKMKDYENANTFAKKAYSLDFPLPGLRNLLVAAGKWTPDAPAKAAQSGPEPATGNAADKTPQ